MSSSASTHIGLPPSAVFDYVADVTHDKNWRTGIRKSELHGTQAPAVRTKGQTRGGTEAKPIDSEWEVIQFVPGRHLRWRFLTGPIEGEGGYRCEPDGDGTTFTLEADVRFTGYQSRINNWIVNRVVRRQNLVDIAKLKSILET